MDTNIIPFVNHAGLDTINQRRLIKIGSKRSLQIIDYIIKLNGLFSGAIPITDTYLLDHRPLQNWLMKADTDLLEYLVPQDDSVLPGVFVTTRAKGNFEDILKTLIEKNRMLFSSQNKDFDRWIRDQNNDPSFDEFVKRDKRGNEWWESYLEKINGLFDENARKVWVFGPYNFPGRLRSYLDHVKQELRPKDPYIFDNFYDLVTSDPPATRTTIVRWLRDNNKDESAYATLTHSAYRAVLAESTDAPGKIVENIARDTWPSDLIPRAIMQAAEKLAEVKPLDLDIDYRILIDKLPWEVLLELRAHEDFKSSLLELSRATSNIDVDEKTMKKAIKNHFKTVGRILENTSAAGLFINRTGTPPRVNLLKFGFEVSATSAIMAAAILTQNFEIALTSIPGYVLMIKDLISFVGNDPLVRLENAFGHVERTLLKEVSFDELPSKKLR